MTAPNPDKLIVSNFECLQNKYGLAGKDSIVAAATNLITADAARGLVTIMVDLSNATTMAGYGAIPVTVATAADAHANKSAIDKVFASFGMPPSYLMLLGSVDIIPHVPLENPVPSDGDADVPSDLPYACDAPYSTDVNDFVAPSRVVGRLPDITNGHDPSYLAGLIDTAINYVSRQASDFNAFLGITADVWLQSSQLSLDAIFGTHAGLQDSPPDGYQWNAAQAGSVCHFINCHGSPADPNFYGQSGANYPIAHSAAYMAGKIRESTVLAAECCYGSQLYDPALAGGQAGMCNTYLQGKAYAYFGSSTIAYGPSTNNDWADLICQVFLLQILGGASAGRACLQARLDYVKNKGGILSANDLKTLAQYNLMADPATTPIGIQPSSKVIPTAKWARNSVVASQAVARHDRIGRRIELIAQAASTAAFRLKSMVAPTAPNSDVMQRLLAEARSRGIDNPDAVFSYAFERPANVFRLQAMANVTSGAMLNRVGPKAVHVILKRSQPPANAPRLTLIHGIEAIEYDDGLDVAEFESR